MNKDLVMYSESLSQENTRKNKFFLRIYVHCMITVSYWVMDVNDYLEA